MLVILQQIGQAEEFPVTPEMSQASFVERKILDAFGEGETPDQLEIKLNEDLPEQAYSLSSDDGVIIVEGGDIDGMMYGALELAERVRLGLPLTKEPIVGKPFVKRRGLKMNIPLDGRCPSYDDSGTAARVNVKEVWSLEFWHGLLDRMAEHRYNTLTLWSNHPFSAMLELKDYPDVALHDVAEATYELDDQMLPQYKQAALQAPKNYRIIKKMPMKDKIAFWRHVMRYAQERGVDIYFITWNIWVHGAEGKYGIDASQENPKTEAYMRECVKQFVLTYPDLKGLGITCGEHMKNKLEGENSVENWMWKTYGQGILDAKAEQPGREVNFIHRIWYTGMDVMKRDFISKYPDPIQVGFKYARARLYSIPNPPFFKRELEWKLKKHGLTSWLNLRNDDIFNFRWGNPDYVRQYIRNLPDESVMAGFYMGPDGYFWGREFTSKAPESPRQLEVDKHWYRFMMWGRLAYNPDLDRAFFEAQLADRFPKVNAAELFETWQVASRIVPLINTFHWRSWDHMWSVETCMSKKEGYHSVDHFIEFGPLGGQGMQGINGFVRKPNPKAKSPLVIADELDQLARETLERVKGLRGSVQGKEFRETLLDLEAFSYLANYYAAKIRGATALHRFRVHGDETHRYMAIYNLEQAVAYWRGYGQVASSLYETQLLARTSDTDWLGRLLKLAQDDIRLVQEAKHKVFPPSVMHSALKK